MISDEISEAPGFRFLFRDESPGPRRVGVRHGDQPVRVLLSEEQLDRLATEAKIASVKLSWRSQRSDSD